eukprot:4402455-Amphidinium_carterae.1
MERRKRFTEYKEVAEAFKDQLQELMNLATQFWGRFGMVRGSQGLAASWSSLFCVSDFGCEDTCPFERDFRKEHAAMESPC